MGHVSKRDYVLTRLDMFLQRKLKLRPFEILVGYITLMFGRHAWRPGAY